MLKIGIFILGLLFCLPVESIDATDLYGINHRPRAQTRSKPKVNRYRTTSTANVTATDCNCDPGLYSVIYLTADTALPIPPETDTITMAQKDTRFEPAVIAVSVGETVGFPNLDPFFHNVFSYSKTKKFDLGRYPQGNSSYVTFDKPGLVNVFCEIHSSMRAFVHVLETPYRSVSDEAGNFTMKNVAPGNYTLHLWQENLSEYTMPLTVINDSMYIEINP